MKKHKKKPIIFDQDAHPYRHSILVCVGADVKDVAKWLLKNGNKGAKKDFPEFLDKYKNLFEEIKTGKKLGYAVKHETEDYLMLILRKYEDYWGYWECLIHELSHILDWLVELKMLDGETEARAYLHEWLFKEIRRKIQGIDPL